MSADKIEMRSRAQLLGEIEELRTRLDEAEQTLQAIRSGEVDALVVKGPQGEQVFSLTGVESVYRVIVETMNEAALTVSPLGAILFCNQRFSNLMKTPIHEVVGRKLADFVEVSHHPGLMELIKQGQMEPARSRLMLLSPDGTHVPAQISASLLNTGAIPCICLVVSDLTQLEASTDLIKFLREHQIELEASQAQLRLAKDSAKLGFFNYDLRTGERKCDEQVRKLCGYDECPMVTKDAQFCIKVHPDDHAAVKIALDQALDPKETGAFRAEYRFLRSDDATPVWVESRGQVLFKEGKPVQLIGAMNDVTERKLSEEALRLSEQRWSTTLASIGDAVIATDMNGQVTFLNAVAEALTGWSMAEATGRPVKEVFRIVNERTRAAVEDPVSKVIQTGMIAGLANHTVLLRRGGGEIPIDDSGAPIRDEEGYNRGVVLVFRDITERKRAEESLQQLNETLEQRVADRTRQLQALAMDLVEAEERERRRFAELLHDDLQQSLAAARMQLQGACECTPPDTEVLANVEQILSESLRKTRRMAHDLSAAMLQHSSLVTSFEWLTRQMKEQFGLQVQLESEGELQFKNKLLKVFLFRSVQELLFNVAKHAGVNTAQVAISSSDKCLAVSVADQGQGFDPGIIDSATTLSGFGLLSMRERARYIGGSLTIESAPGKGSGLTLKVPISLSTGGAIAPALDRQPPTMEKPPASTSTGSLRVLFVDDHHVMRKGLIRLMNGQPVVEVVGEAANGQEAIEKVRDLRPDVVVMDVSMPVMDGIEATRRIKAEWPEVRVIALSMHDDEQISRKMRKAGAEAFMSKTASPAELLKTIYGTDRKI